MVVRASGRDVEKTASTVHCRQISCEEARANRTAERVELKSADI